MRTALVSLIVLATAFATTGCVTGRRVIDLADPVATAVPATRGVVAVTEVLDRRAFENKPRSPSTPSIDGDVTAASPDMLATMIGRQRNGYGAAMGDIQLAAGATVTSEARALVEQGLRARGFTVGPAGTGDASVAIDVNKFWGWFSPGFATISFEAQIETSLKVTRAGETRSVVVNGYGKNVGQVASDANWQKAFSLAFDDFLKNASVALESVGL